jgi:hypothetical protein
LSLRAIEPDFINSCRTATGQNVAFVNLNGALDINKPEKQAFIAPKKGFQNRVMHQLKIAIGGKSNRRTAPPAFDRCVPGIMGKKNGARRLRFFQTDPNQANFLCRTRCGWAAASPKRFLRSASYSV